MFTRTLRAGLHAGLAIAAVAASAMGGAGAADFAIVHAGTLLAVPGKAPAREQTVVVKDGIIAKVAPGYLSAEQAGAGEGDTVRLYELKDMFVLPGLIDGHVHLTSENNPNARLQRVEMSSADRAMMGALYARRTLLAGFTTVRDLGGDPEAIFALRDGINKGWVEGPRIYAAGALITPTGGHADGSQGYADDLTPMLQSSGVCDGVADCRRAVRDMVRRGADQIKLTATGGVLSNTAAGVDQQFYDDELHAIIDTAHMMGRKATAHAHGTNGINAALKDGIDSIEHGTYLDDESIRLFRKTGAYLVPTILAGVTVAEWAADPNTFLTPAQKAKAAKVGPLMLDMARRAHKGGVKIAFGTDSGVSKHGQNAREFGLLVEAGLTPMEAIKAATVSGADNLGHSDVVGSIEPGKSGDIVAVDGDPLNDVSELLDVDFVMKAGVEYKGPAAK